MGLAREHSASTFFRYMRRTPLIRVTDHVVSTAEDRKRVKLSVSTVTPRIYCCHSHLFINER
jgi:hypothetical protein